MHNRYYSLDVFRGMTVAFMIMVNNPATWSEETKNIFAPLRHANWHGCTPTDLIFPFFLFAVGNAMAFVMPRFYAANGDSMFWKKVIKRTLLIFGIGFLLLSFAPYLRYTGTGELVFKTWEWKNFDCNQVFKSEAGVRILGVLQRIALCYFFASVIIYFGKQKGAFYFSIIILLWYWLICTFGASTPDPYSVEGFVGRQLDIDVLGVKHIIKENGLPFDPEGLLSTIPAIVSVIFGYLVGDYIQRKGKSFEMLSNLFVAGLILVFGGLIWETAMPLNKKLWTSSYVLYTTGLATLVLGVLIYLIEFKKINEQAGVKIKPYLPVVMVAVITGLFLWYGTTANNGWDTLQLLRIVLAAMVISFILLLFLKNGLFKFFDVFGKNPLFIFVLAGFLPRLLQLIRIPVETAPGKCQAYLNPMTWMGEKLCLPAFDDPKTGSLLYAMLIIILYWFIAYLMDKKKIYVKV